MLNIIKIASIAVLEICKIMLPLRMNALSGAHPKTPIPIEA